MEGAERPRGRRAGDDQGKINGSGAALRALIGRAYALNPALIVCGAGSDELLKLLAHAFLGPGDEAIHNGPWLFSLPYCNAERGCSASRGAGIELYGRCRRDSQRLTRALI